jgi:hypothetical protein
MAYGLGSRVVFMMVVSASLGCTGASSGDDGSTGGTAEPVTSGTTDGGGSGSSGVLPGTGTDTPTSTVDPTVDPTSDPTSTGDDTGVGPTSDASSDESSGGTDTGDPPVDGWMERSKARVFVSGHSLTDNPLVDHMALIAGSLGRDFDYNQQIGIGSPIRVRTLGDSWDNLDWPGYRDGKNKEGSDMDIIAEFLDPQTIGPGERYDTLVITERHDILGTIQWEDTTGLLRHYHDRMIDGNPDGETLLYHSWLTMDTNAPQAWIDHEKGALAAWECVASKVNHTLEADGRADRVRTLPVGAALVDLVERVLADEVAGISGSTQQRMGQLFTDGVHLTPTGVYFAALVTHAAVFHGSPVGADVPPGVAADTAAALQQIAWDFVRGYYTTEGVGVRTMESCRDLIAGSVCGTFWTLLDNPGNVQGCQGHFANPDANNGQNPFKWPDPGLVPWPDP